MKLFTPCSIIDSKDDSIIVSEAVFVCNYCSNFERPLKVPCQAFLIRGVDRHKIEDSFIRYGFTRYQFNRFFIDDRNQKYVGIRINPIAHDHYYMKKRSKRIPLYRELMKDISSIDAIKDIVNSIASESTCRCYRIFRTPNKVSMIDN